MQNLGAIERQLGCLAIVDVGEHARIGHALRIGGHQPVDFLEERHAARAEAARDDGGGKIRAAPAEGDHFIVGAAANVSGNHDHLSLVE